MHDERGETGADVKAVVYATDFSICSHHAGLYALQLAKCLHAELFVAHAFTLSEAAMEAEALQPGRSVQRKELKSLLTHRAALLARDAEQAIPILLEGDPKKVIAALADENAPALIVLGTHGRGRLERGMLGSIAEEILRSSNWPSLTVGPLVRPSSAATMQFKRILFATDLSASAGRAASFAISFARIFGGSVEVLHVVSQQELDSAEELSRIEGRLAETVSKVYPNYGVCVRPPRIFVEAGSAHDRIVQHISEHGIDLLVLGLKRTAYVRTEMRLSGAFRTIVDAPCPVLTVNG